MVHDHARWAQAYGLGGVAGYLLAPIGNLLGAVTQAVGQLTQSLDSVVDDWVTRHRRHDQYVVPGVHWDSFSHKALYAMVHQQASPPQVEGLADDWSRHGRALTERAEELQRSLAALLPYWGGAASEQAARSVIDAVGWIGDVGSTTSAMSDPLQDSAGALRSAQATMPPPPGGGGWLAGAGAGAAVGFAVGGPVGAGIGAAIGGIGSAFGFGSSKEELKRRAVQTMQRYETAGVQVDTTTPQFVDSGVRRIGQAEYDARRIGAAPIAGTRPVDAIAGTAPAAAGPGGSGFGAGTGAGAGRGPGGVSWRELTARSGPNGLLGAGASGLGRGGFAGAGVGGFGPGGVGGLGAGVGGSGTGRGGGSRGGAFGPGGRYGSAGRWVAGMPEEELAGRRAAGMAGSPLMPGAGAGHGDDDRDHRRRYPYEDQPFKLDATVAPPVIGN